MATSFLLVLIGLSGLLLAAITWRALVMRWYRTAEPEPLTCVCDDGWQLQLYRTRPAHRVYREPIVLCHGLANNHRILTFQLAKTLAGIGFESYAVDLRGILNSARAPPGARRAVTVDDIVRHDVPAIVRAVREASGCEQLIWLGHSMGGMVGLAGATKELSGHLKAVVTVGTPIAVSLGWAARTLLVVCRVLAWPWRLRLEWVAPLVAPFAGWFSVPGAHGVANQRNLDGPLARASLALAIGPIWRGVLDQFHRWSKDDSFRSADGTVDYRERIGALTAPVLVLGGDADLLAPPQMQKRLYELLTHSSDKTLVMFGKSRGDTWDYGHGDLVIGLHVAREVYPVLLQWLQEKATRA